MLSAVADTYQRRDNKSSQSYFPPREIQKSDLSSLVIDGGRDSVDSRQLALLGSKNDEGVIIYSCGDLALLNKRVVAIVGSRAASEKGLKRAERLARELVENGVVISSGLAKGIDTSALSSAIKSDGKVIAVIGTPLDKAYPAANKRLQEQIYTDHLLLTPFQSGQRVYPSNFPQRNRVMALLSDATVIVEASDTSGTLHQAAECQRQGRWLFILKSLVENPEVSWPKNFLDHPKTAIVESTKDILSRINDAGTFNM